jgi:hypothetical protein
LQSENRQVRRNDDGAREKHRPLHLVRGLLDLCCGSAPVPTLRQVADDVLDHHHRAIDEHAEVESAESIIRTKLPMNRSRDGRSVTPNLIHVHSSCFCKGGPHQPRQS